jgi:hypothetical protein
MATRGRNAAGTRARIENRNVLFNLKLSSTRSWVLAG